MSTTDKSSGEKAPPISRAYWVCQLAGWSALLLFQLLVLGLWRTDSALSDPRLTNLSTPRLYVALALLCASGLILSHVVYLQMRRRQWLHMPLRRAWPRLVAAVALAGAVQSAINTVLSIFLIRAAPLREEVRPAVRLVSWFIYVVLFAIWLMIYLAVHEFRRRRIAEVNALRLELVAQEAQLQGLRAQLNPHFLFNCLNSLRELIVEDPRRAQAMVTQLSGLLRYSLQSDHMEQVLLEDEVQAVKDYLALEAIRFEERLRVHWSIAPEAGRVPVPPMLLQTLVENALKHGISRLPEGGEISIQALVRDSQLQLEVVNSGGLPEQSSEDGIGLRNARSRLQLLYGDQAKIVLESADATHDHVRAVGTIPVRRTKAVP
jgi:two-component system, LytTR family, sensor histidine kinase AlgZ